MRFREGGRRGSESTNVPCPSKTLLPLGVTTLLPLGVTFVDALPFVETLRFIAFPKGNESKCFGRAIYLIWNGNESKFIAFYGPCPFVDAQDARIYESPTNPKR